VTRRQSNLALYTIVVTITICGIAVIALILSNSAIQSVETQSRLVGRHLELALILGMICLTLGMLMIPVGQSLSADVADIIGKVAEPSSSNAGIEKEISNQLNYILNALNSHSEITRAFSSSIEEAGRNLLELTTPEQLRSAIGLLVVENNKMRKETSSLQSDLSAAKLQIDSLKENLEEAEESGLRDPLTSLWNRRAFDNILDIQTRVAPRKKLPLCLIMADIDHFKKVNDSFGHTIGDEVIRHVATTISQNVKGKDAAARYGGEEFAVILPETELVNAVKIAEQIKQKLESQKWILRRQNQAIGPVTASFGVAEFRAGEKKTNFIGRADENLYRAKNSGRNCVVGQT
jgi:diguanylate cyclase